MNENCKEREFSYEYSQAHDQGGALNAFHAVMGIENIRRCARHEVDAITCKQTTSVIPYSWGKDLLTTSHQHCECCWSKEKSRQILPVCGIAIVCKYHQRIKELSMKSFTASKSTRQCSYTSIPSQMKEYISEPGTSSVRRSWSKELVALNSHAQYRATTWPLIRRIGLWLGHLPNSVVQFLLPGVADLQLEKVGPRFGGGNINLVE